MKQMKQVHLFAAAFLSLVAWGCQHQARSSPPASDHAEYLHYNDPADRLSGGVKLIPVETPKGTFRVWTKQVGNNPRMKVLLLHGGPGATHEYYECFDAFLPEAGIEYYYYDQLESAYSDQPNDPDLWTIDRYVEEVEQVRKALGLDRSNFYLLGNSWGGILGMEYALKYQENLKGLIIANMMASIPDYNRYADEVLGPQMPAEVLEEVKALEAQGSYQDPRYLELLYQHYYTQHILRMPLAEWPDPVNRAFSKANSALYVAMQGPSEFGIRGDATLLNWDRTADLPEISVPTLVIGAAHDTMDPEHMEWMAGQVQNGEYLHCPNGSHLALYDDQEVFFDGLISFIRRVDQDGRSQ